MRLYREFNIQLTSTSRPLLLSDWKRMWTCKRRWNMGWENERNSRISLFYWQLTLRGDHEWIMWQSAAGQRHPKVVSKRLSEILFAFSLIPLCLSAVTSWLFVVFMCLIAGCCVSVVIWCLLFVSMSHCRTLCCLCVCVCVCVCIAVPLCCCLESFLSFADLLSYISFHSHFVPLFNLRLCLLFALSCLIDGLCLIVVIMCFCVTRAGVGLIFSPGVSCLRPAHLRSQPIILKLCNYNCIC